MTEPKTTKNLNDVMNEAEQEAKKTQTTTGVTALNADIPTAVMKDLKLISVYNEKSIKEILTELVTRYVKKEKKRVIERLMDE